MLSYVKHILLFSFLLISLISGCSDDKPKVESTSSITQKANNFEDDEYTSIDSIELDFLLLKNHPDITQDFPDKFNFRWLRAYDCENTKDIENDMNLFQQIQTKLISDAIGEARDTTNKFKVWGGMTIYMTEDDRNVWKLKRIAYKTSFRGGRYKKDAECKFTKTLNTSHSLKMKQIPKDKTIQLSDEVVDKLTISRISGARVFVVVKFTLDESNYEYNEDKNYFKVKHRGEFEEVTFYATKHDMNDKNNFLILSKDELYY